MSDDEGIMGWTKRLHAPLPVGGGQVTTHETNIFGKPKRHNADEARAASQNGSVVKSYDDDGNETGAFWNGAKW